MYIKKTSGFVLPEDKVSVCKNIKDFSAPQSFVEYKASLISHPQSLEDMKDDNLHNFLQGIFEKIGNYFLAHLRSKSEMPSILQTKCQAELNNLNESLSQELATIVLGIPQTGLTPENMIHQIEPAMQNTAAKLANTADDYI